MRGRPPILAPLGEPAFRFLVIGRTVTMLGNTVASLALPFAVLDLTGSVKDLGLVAGSRSIASVLFLLLGGLVADHVPRQHVLVASSIVAAATQATTAALLLSGSATVVSLAVLAGVNGMVTAFTWPAASALVPLTVPDRLLAPANVLNRIGVNTAMISGALLGSALVVAAGPGVGLLVDAVAFAGAAAVFAALRPGRPPVTSSTRVSPWRDLREGWREFTSHTWLWGIVVAFTAFNAALAATTGVLGPAAADRDFGRHTWGLMVAAQTAGMVLGGILALRVRSAHLLRHGVLCIFGQIPLMLALAGTGLPVVLVLLAFLAGVAFEQFSVAWEVTVQRYVAPALLARVYSYDAFGSFLAIPLGQTLAGPAATRWGLSPALFATAAVSFAAIIGILCIRDVWTLPTHPPPRAAPGLPEPSASAAGS